MKRLFAVIGFTYLITLTVFIFLCADYYWILLSIFVFCEVVSLIIKDLGKDKILPTVFLVCIIASCSYMINYYKFIVPSQTLYDKDITITGQVCELPYRKDDKFHYILNVEKINQDSNIKNFKVDISSYNALSLNVYDNVTFDVHTYSYNSSKSDVFKQYNFSKKIYLSGYLLEYKNSPVISSPKSYPFYYYSLNIRKSMMSLYRKMFSEEYSSVINGVLFGDRYSIPDDVKNNFIASGIYHILAVSGLHTTIISQIILSVLIRLRVNKRLSALLAAISVFLFMSVSCFTPSVVRAGIMSMIYLIGLAIYKQSDPLNSLGMSVLIISIINPNIGGSISLWLSFLSTLGLIVLYPKIFFYLRKYFKSENKLIKYILESVSLTASVILSSSPLCAIVFKKIYLSSFVSNILILPFIPFLIFNSWICAALYVLFPSGIWKLSGIINLCIIKYMNYVCSFLSRVSFFRVFLGYRYIELVILIGLLVLGATFIMDKLRKHIKLVFLSVVNVLVIFCLCSRISKIDDVIISVLNSSDNFSVVLSKGRKNTVIYCGGNSTVYKNIPNYLYNIDSHKLDFIILPKFSMEQYKTVNKVVEEYGTNYMVVPGRCEFDEETKMINSFNCKKYLFDESLKLSLYNDVNICIFKADNKPWIYLDVYNSKILCCLEGGNVLNLPDEFKSADVLISSGLPTSFERIGGIKDIIFSSRKKDYNILENKINYHNIRNFNMGKSGNIEMRLKKSGVYKISEGI